MASSLFFPFSPAWCFPVPSWGGRPVDVFVVCFEGSAPEGFVAWCRGSGVVVEKVFPAVPWRSFRAGVAVRLRVSEKSIADAVRKSASKGAGGSLHPACGMLF